MKWTDEEIKRLGESLVSPLRCGGLDYIDGKPYYRIQGWLIPAEIIEQSKQANNGDPWPGIREWQRTHEPYVK